jgi:serine/threonine-protein kinase RsbW
MERRVTLLVRSDLRHLSLVAACVRGICSEHLAGEQARGLVELALVEACSNAIRHNRYGDSAHVFELDVRVRDEAIEFVLTDEGPPFDFSARGLPPLDQCAPADLPEGGFGVPLIHAIMDEAECRREGARNVLRLVKRR